MKRIKSINGYTIYEANARDAARDNSVEAGYFYIYFSSDIRAYGRAYSYVEMEAGSLEEAIAFCTGSNYAAAMEYVEASTTAASHEEITAVEKLLDSGLTMDEIAAAEEEAEEEEENETVQAMQRGILFYVHVVSINSEHFHGPYFSMEAADAGAAHYASNTGAEYLPPVNN